MRSTSPSPSDEVDRSSSGLGSLLPHQQSPSMTSSQTLYIPIASPPTPAPSPGPVNNTYHQFQSSTPFSTMNTQHPAIRRHFLSSIISSCTPAELSFVSQTITLRLKRDFLYSLPTELTLNVLSFIDDPKTLIRASQVSKHWRATVRDESVWRRMCLKHGFDDWDLEGETPEQRKKRWRTKSKTPPVGDNNGGEVDGRREMEQLLKGDPTSDRLLNRRTTLSNQDISFSYWRHFKMSYITHTKWRRGGTLLRSHRLPIIKPDNGTVTSLALDSDWVVVGLANSKIQVFSARTGVLTRTLVGHESEVWGVFLVSRGGYRSVGTDKSRAQWEGEKTRTTSSGQSEDFDPSQPSMRTLRDGVAGIDLHRKLDDKGGMHVMPSESLDFLVSPEMRIALGLGPLTDDEYEDSGLYNHHEDAHSRTEAKARPTWRDTSPEGRGHVGKGDTATEDFPGIGVGQGTGPDKPSSMCYASQGWGQPNSLIVSGGCDKVVRVWDAESGRCIYVLHGHTSTIRTLRVLHNRPITVTGSRDSTLRVWDIQRGVCLRVLEGHQMSVRCLDVCGNRVVSGSYDNTCRLWDIDTGECLFILQGHFQQIYCVAFDGVRIVSGGLDTTVRVWDAENGECLALLQGHTALVCQIQLSPTILATGGSDGRVIIFSLDTYTPIHRIAAHDSSVISLQFNKHFLVTGGNDGRVRLFETETGDYVRDLLMEPGDSVWKVAFVKCTCVIVFKRAGKTVVEIWSLLGGGNRQRERRLGYEEERREGGAIC